MSIVECQTAIQEYPDGHGTTVLALEGAAGGENFTSNSFEGADPPLASLWGRKTCDTDRILGLKLPPGRRCRCIANSTGRDFMCLAVIAATPDERERMTLLCQQIQVERDPHTFRKLVAQLNELLEQKEHRLTPVQLIAKPH